ncbi:MAG: dihydrolipoyl dehydrogenase [Spirochaetes bacterium]|nr:dihydrolipoyl dehydrogenase [Spirochaetota bacterium]
MYDLIIIGAGPGGYEAAAHAGRMKKKVLLVEKQYIGGTCLNVGCIPTKTLLRSAKAFSEAGHASLYGVECGAPKFLMNKVLERKNAVVGQLTKGVEGMLKRAGVEIVRGTAKIVERNAIEVDGKRTEGSNILIATGSVPAKPPIPGLDNPKVIDSTGALDLATVPESIAIIGGGVIGLEFASFFSEVGAKVTIVEMLPNIAPVIDGDISKRLQEALRKAGVVFHLSAKVQKVDGATLFFTDSEGKEQKLTSTYILNATGRRPITENLGLETVGVDFDRKGVKTNAEGRTNVPGIWACGDVTGRMQLAHVATREGVVAVNNMFGAKDRMRYDAIPSVVYTHPEVAGVGRTEEQLQKDGVEYKKNVMPMAVAGRFTVEHEGQNGTVKVLAGSRGEILGVHMIGDPCSELIHSAALMIEMELRVKDIRDVVFPHPTVSEALKETILHL